MYRLNPEYLGQGAKNIQKVLYKTGKEARSLLMQKGNGLFGSKALILLLYSNKRLDMKSNNLLMSNLIRFNNFVFQGEVFSKTRQDIFQDENITTFVTYLLSVHFTIVPNIHVILIYRRQIQ